MDDVSLLKSVEHIPETTKYWFIRTNSGEYFDTYYENGFIAINWNEIDYKEILKLKGALISEKLDQVFIDNLRLKTARIVRADLTTSSGKSKVTGILNKLMNFTSLKKDDVVIMPGFGSSILAFGTIRSNKLLESTTHNCPHAKRRHVDWLFKRPMSELDDAFYKIPPTHHSMSEIDKKFHRYIDRMMHPVLIKNNIAHLAIEVKPGPNVNTEDLLRFISIIKEVSNEINYSLNLNEPTSEIGIRINVQSDGIIEFIQKEAKTLLYVGALVAVVSCRPGETVKVPSELQEYMNKHPNSIKILGDSSKALGVEYKEYQDHEFTK